MANIVKIERLGHDSLVDACEILFEMIHEINQESESRPGDVFILELTYIPEKKTASLQSSVELIDDNEIDW